HTQLKYDVHGRKTESVDPDMGTWTYGYNGFGDLVHQTDAKNPPVTMTYDVLGRLKKKTDPTAGTAEWVYDRGPGGVGKLAAMISGPDPKLNAPCDNVPYVEQSGGNR